MMVYKLDESNNSDLSILEPHDLDPLYPSYWVGRTFRSGRDGQYAKF